MTDTEKLAHIREFLSNSLVLFEMDPADTRYQKGFKASVVETKQYVDSLD